MAAATTGDCSGISSAGRRRQRGLNTHSSKLKTEFSKISSAKLVPRRPKKASSPWPGPAATRRRSGPVQKYLKEWYGYRPAQCKALIAMLSTIDHPSATQYLLSIANRFRTKGIREEAEKYVNALAERKGWTLDELADRTLPTAGLGDDGTLELSFGPRQFQLRVTPNLEAVLTDPDGKTLKALPAPRKDDDEEQAKAAKKAFSAAKTELKKFAGMQTTRLYEAMCTQRTWTVADWQTYLMGHPLMKFLCQRLVWAVCDDTKPSPPAPLPEGEGAIRPDLAPLPSAEHSRREGQYLTFRPLDDGTFTDYEDNEVQLPADARLRIAHSCHVAGRDGRRLGRAPGGLQRHAAVHAVRPRDLRLARRETQGNGNQRFRRSHGRGLQAPFPGDQVRLHPRAGPGRRLVLRLPQELPGPGAQGLLNFSGNGLPEENRQVALKDISFQQAAAEEESMMQMSGGMPLDEVPAVLLSECYNDLRTIAAAGTGFDPGWEKKIGY